MTLFNQKLYLSFKSKEVIKVISGLNNTNIEQIIRLAKAAELSGATYLDIIANSNIVKSLKLVSNLPICVSSINPIDLYNCVISGADLVEIGNFDTFYKQNIYLNPREIINLAKETRSLVGNVDICVTIPYYLHLNDQIKLARNLEYCGINFLQTEALANKKSNIVNINNDNIFYSTNLSSFSLSSTYAISSAVKIPVLTSSGMNALSSAIALHYGASGIGIGSTVSQKINIYNMCLSLRDLRKSISSNTVYNYKNIILDSMIYEKNQFIY